MERKIVYGIVLIAFLTGILTLQTSIQPAKASDGFGYIYIKADGSIDPPDAPISKDAENVTYSLTADIANRTIIIERDNIIFDGNNCKISGPEEYGRFGINLTNRNNIVIKNTVVEKFHIGIYVLYSTKITITGNNASYNKIFWITFDPEYQIFWEGDGIAVLRSNETLIFNNTLSNNLYGTYIGQSNNTRIYSNKIYDNKQYESTWFGWGISIYESKNVTAINNLISNNAVYGIYGGALSAEGYGSGSVIHNNTISGHEYGVSIRGYDVVARDYAISENSIFSNNWGVYVNKAQNQTIMNNNVSSNTCGICLVGSTNNTIINNTLFENAYGITFGNSVNHSRILFNTILRSSAFGINISDNSNNNLLVGNNITLNGHGISITYDCHNTKIFHNNFIDNTQHVFTDMNSTWDNGYPSGGNYWSNYTGVDIKWGVNQNETGSDGIGDTKHIINENNTDCYPLMAPINLFDAGVWEEKTQYAKVISNSTVSNFQINTTEKIISFNVTGETGAGFCRVIIPKVIADTLWLGNYMVLVNGVPVEFRNWTDTENVYLYFTYSHSEKEVVIIPEFSSIAFMPLLMLLTMLTLIMKKLNRKNQ
jgi:parallel beta-helix repeat protein